MRSRLRSTPLLAVVFVGLLASLAHAGDPARLGSLASGRITSSAPFEPDERTCLEPVPEAAGVSGITDSGKTVSLDAVVLLDRVSLSKGRTVMRKATRSYAPLDIRLRVVRFERVAFPSDGRTTDASGNRVATGDYEKLFRLMKKRFHGKRPRGSDLVYMLTSKDIYASDSTGRNYGVAGVADCIGGVRFPSTAFAMGEVFRPENLEAGPLTFYVNASAKIAAHEIGHLMGAHHHYSNCVEGIPTELRQGEPSPCTLMINAIDFASINFGQVEAAVVRGHAVEFAD